MNMTQTFSDFIKDMRDDAIGPLAQDIKKQLKTTIKPFGPRPPKKAKPVKLGKIEFWPPERNKIPLPPPPGESEPIKPQTFSQFLKSREKEQEKRAKANQKAAEKARMWHTTNPFQPISTGGQRTALRTAGPGLTGHFRSRKRRVRASLLSARQVLRGRS